MPLFLGSAVCQQLLQNGAEVLAVDRSARAIEELRQQLPSVEARVVDCTDEESLREAGILDMDTVVVAISEPIEASITATLIAKDGKGTRVRRVIARATSDLHEKMLKRVGADRVVFPSRMQGERLGLELVRPNLMERLELDERHVNIRFHLHDLGHVDDRQQATVPYKYATQDQMRR